MTYEEAKAAHRLAHAWLHCGDEMARTRLEDTQGPGPGASWEVKDTWADAMRLANQAHERDYQPGDDWTHAT